MGAKKSKKQTLTGYSNATFFGGLMTLMMICILVGYFAYRVVTIYATNEYDYVKRELTYSEQEMNDMNYTMGQFSDSFNFAFGFNHFNPNFDSLNNPYVQFVGMEGRLNDMGRVESVEKYEIQNCNSSYMDRIVEEHNQAWYFQPLCFKDLD